ncbi:hypothetical protein Poli38472_013353 [Pythium oligandrum]|uniref:Uncharacterized protein n=1 Tax=Pythium oligandrum TaxID=41045 RepID=A0A8K1C766_PYTOL|nr:hypothetical protein Poli38472_013353 [Pythium oligandrum]|eukprot:TMW57879.1 hypothetical protein Poli38472_013353 [Pythium oligandrum]
MVLNAERMEYARNVALMPLALIINFSLFQYLMGMYFNRRSEARTMLLLVCAFISFVAIIPFSHPDRDVFTELDSISQTAATLTFLIQIVVIGRDVTKKVKIRSVLWMTYVSEVLIMLEVVVIIATVAELVYHGLRSVVINDTTDILGNISLWFVFVFRFYYISIGKGFRRMLMTKRTEIFLYFLFATNEYPYYGLEAATGISWEPVQALWSRVTLMMCLLHTIQHKLRSNSSKATGWKTRASHASPSKAQSKHSYGPTEVRSRRMSLSKTRSAAQSGKSLGPSLRDLVRLGPSFRSAKIVVPMVK